MNGILQDVRFALRHFSKRSLWTAMIVAVLTLGIGANTAMYTGFDAWVMRPLDFHEPDRLVALHETQPALGWSGGVSSRDLGDWLEQQQSFEAVGVFSRTRFNLSDEIAPSGSTAPGCRSRCSRCSASRRCWDGASASKTTFRASRLVSR